MKKMSLNSAASLPMTAVPPSLTFFRLLPPLGRDSIMRSLLPHLKYAHLVGMCPVLVLGPVGGIAEGLGAPGELARVRLLPSVRAQVRLEVLQSRVGLVAHLKLQRKKEKDDDKTLL